MRSSRGRNEILIAALLLLLTLIIAGGIGTVRIPPLEVVRILVSRAPGLSLVRDWAETNEAILWNIRFPRVMLAMLAGMSLSVAGCGYQGLFKNPLADPYILGVSAGAALGASVSIAFGQKLGHALVGSVPLLAFVSGLLAVTLVYRLAVVGRRVPVVGLLLAGVAVGSVCISLVSTVLYFTTPDAREAINFWLMGGLGGASWAKVGWLLPYVAVGIAIFLYYGRELNAMLMGEESARHLGVDVEQVKRVLLIAGSLLTAAAVAFCGTIGFVGMVVPHLVRLAIGPDHRYLLPASALLGAVLLVGADTLARTVLAPKELPVGLVMALLGGPFFLAMLRRKLKPADA